MSCLTPADALADAIVVLGCRITPSGRPGAPAARRAATAASAYLAGVAPIVVASGGRRWGAHTEARALKLELVRRGVPAEAVIEELLSLSTVENAIFSGAALRLLVGPRRPPRAAVVTCPWHMARALASFSSAGVDTIAQTTPLAPMRLGRRVAIEIHELVCRPLDVRRIAHAHTLIDEAARFAAMSKHASLTEIHA